MWEQLKSVRDPTLVKLASDLPRIASQSRQSSTVKGYVAGFRRWKAWAAKFDEISALPASPIYVAIYLSSIMQTANSVAPINCAFYSLSWAHKMAGLADPTDNDMCKLVKEAAHRSLGHAARKKDPVTPKMLQSLVSHFSADRLNLLTLRLLVMCVLAYAGFLRFDELLRIRACDIQMGQSHFSIFIEKAKNDVYRDGKWVLIAKTDSPTCPHTLLKSYIDMANIDYISDNYIFRQLSFFKSQNKYKLKSINKPLSYTRAREIVLAGFKAIGVNSINLGTHSLRAGGATCAANNGVPDRLFKRHGRWLSEKAKDGYIKDDVDNILSVSRSIGL